MTVDWKTEGGDWLNSRRCKMEERKVKEEEKK
jgi:hypothetical protein